VRLLECAGWAVLLGALAVSSCKKAPTAPDPPPVQTTTITITSSGASPKNVEVPVGARVLFINQDSRSHNMTSDPHPEHTDCLEVNQAGFLSPGARRETGNLVQAKTCGYHDHDDPNNTGLSGRIVIR
jgi:plastocyanin